MKLLFIPHIYSDKVKIRSLEFARALSMDNNRDIYFLRWNPIPDSQTAYVNKIKLFAGNILNPLPAAAENRITFVSCPLILRESTLAMKFNGYFLRRLIDKLDVDVIINAAYYYFPVSRIIKPEIEYIYDLVDDHTENCLARNKSKYEKYILNEMYSAAKRLVVSKLLQKKIENNWNLACIPVFNGAEVKNIRQQTQHKNKELLSKYNLTNNKVIGYIGNFGSWAGLDFLTAAFLTAKNKYDFKSKLLIVGPGDDITKYKDMHPDIIFTGRVKPETIPDYLSVMDIGVLPFKRNPFTDNAFPLKIIEYGAAGIPVISTSLKELALHNLDFVIYSDNTEEWADYFYNTDKSHWRTGWDNSVNKYSWVNLVKLIGV